jgi:hypothetical protein
MRNLEHINLIYNTGKDYRGEGVYVIEFFDGSIKVGRSKLLKKRLNVYTNPWTKEIANIKIYAVYNSLRVENKLCSNFKKFKVKNSREYFVGVDYKEIISFLESDEGFTNKFKSSPVKKKVKNRTKKQTFSDQLLNLMYDYKDLE